MTLVVRFKFFKRWDERVHVLIEIREERSDDVVAVREVNRRAFGKDQESNIVEPCGQTEALCFR
jgi:hypothetical protein